MPYSWCLVYLNAINTHWGWVTLICVGKLTIIVSHNGLSHGRHNAIIWTNAGILLNQSLGNKLQRNSYIFIQENAFQNVVCEMAAILSWFQYVKYRLASDVSQTGMCLDTIYGRPWTRASGALQGPSFEPRKETEIGYCRHAFHIKYGVCVGSRVVHASRAYWTLPDQGPFCVCTQPMTDDVTV